MITTIVLGLLLVALIGENYVDHDPVTYYGAWRSPLVIFAPLLVPIPGISLSTIQLLLIAIAPFCLVGSRDKPQSIREMHRAIYISLACIAVTFLWGLIRGGSGYFAYYQVWRFMTALLVAFILTSVMRTPRDLAALGKMVVFAALVKATLCIYYYWTYLYGKVYPLPEYVTSHDDSIVFAAATLVLAVWIYMKGGKAVWTAALLMLGYIFYAIVLNDRRIAWVEIAVGAPAIYLLLGPGPLRTQINRWLLFSSPLILLYVVVGWGREGALFAPVRAFSSTGSVYDPSSLTRQEEIRNLLYTLVNTGNPIFGTGWGIPYVRLEHYWSNYSAEWTTALYTPHNSLLGMAAFSGIVGIVGSWGVIPVAAFLAARGFRRSTEPVPRGATMVAVGLLGAYTVHCYGDVGLQSLYCNLIFGMALGVAAKVAAWSEALPATEPVMAPAKGRFAPVPRPTYGNRGATRGRHEPPPSPKATPGAVKPNRASSQRLSR